MCRERFTKTEGKWVLFKTMTFKFKKSWWGKNIALFTNVSIFSFFFNADYVRRSGGPCEEDEIPVGEPRLFSGRWVQIQKWTASVQAPYLRRSLSARACRMRLEVKYQIKRTFSPLPTDCPASLVSSESVSVPVEASVEDLHGIQAQPQHIQSDAAVSSPLPLEEKLNQELQYHERGNYGGGTQFDIANGNFYSTSNPFLPNLHPDPTVTHLGQDRLSSSSVHSFTRAEPVHPSGQDERWYPPSGDLSLSMQSSAPSKPHLATSVSMPFIPQPNRENHCVLDRQKSWSTFPVTDTSAPEINPGSLLAPSNSRLRQDSGGYANLYTCIRRDVLSDRAVRAHGFVGFDWHFVCFLCSGPLIIQNANGIQIGSNNQMNFKSCDSCSLSASAGDSCSFSIKQGIQKYSKCQTFLSIEQKH